jgi:hypothetical protein
MSRWLLHYTPQATIVRLLTVDAINGYLTSWVLHLTGGFEDPRLILPAWIVISTVWTLPSIPVPPPTPPTPPTRPYPHKQTKLTPPRH